MDVVEITGIPYKAICGQIQIVHAPPISVPTGPEVEIGYYDVFFQNAKGYKSVRGAGLPEFKPSLNNPSKN